jgi:hypothetical protein
MRGLPGGSWPGCIALLLILGLSACASAQLRPTKGGSPLALQSFLPFPGERRPAAPAACRWR